MFGPNGRKAGNWWRVRLRNWRIRASRARSILVGSAMLPITLLLLSIQCRAATLAADVSGIRPGPISVTISGDSLAVRWPDEVEQPWVAEFSLDPAKALITRLMLKDRV